MHLFQRLIVSYIYCKRNTSVFVFVVWAISTNQNKVYYHWLHNAPRVKRLAFHSYWGSLPLGPNFTGTDPLPKCWLCYNFVGGSWQLSFVADLMVFDRNFCEKQHIWVSKPNFGQVRGDARPWFMARWKAHGRLSICTAVIEPFRYLLRFWSYEVKCVQLGCFRRCRPLCTQTLPGQGRPYQPFFASKN